MQYYRGKGSRRHVGPTNPMPRNWREFLRNDDNKAELFSFLTNECANLQLEQGQIIVTHHEDMLCNWARDTTSLASCTQEEADSRIFLHALDASNYGYNKIMVRTVDTNVLILAKRAFHYLETV